MISGFFFPVSIAIIVRTANGPSAFQEARYEYRSDRTGNSCNDRVFCARYKSHQPFPLAFGWEESPVIERVCWLIARHHTYTGIAGDDYQALFEADFIVNADEDKMRLSVIESFMINVFETKTGIAILRRIYSV